MILVVDDEPGVLRLCQRLLERAGFSVTTRSSSGQALEVLESEQVELLLADIRMPGASGFQLLELARQRNPELSVVLMTGYGTIDVAIDALHRGADGLILKPFEGAELIRGVEDALQGSQRRRDSLRLRVLRPLFDVSEKFFSETRPQDLRRSILEAERELLPCALAGLFQRSGGNLTQDIVELNGQSIDEQLEQAIHELAAYIANGTNPLKVDLQNDRGNVPESVVKILKKHGFQSILCAPVPKKGNVLVLFAGRGSLEKPYTDADLEMLVVLAQQAAAALENARLYGELRHSLDQLEKSQQALLRAEKVAAAGRLTASIAHEINNPLQSLGNCLDLASRLELSNESREKYLKVAQNELDRLMMTVQRMLNLFRPGAKERQWIKLDQVVGHVLTLLDEQMKRNHIQARTHIPSPAPVILAVSDQIQQVLINLCINAIEAMPSGGEVTVDITDCDDHVEIRVQDTGPGIAESEHAHIFEPFISKKEYGTGLGLAVSYGIVQAHGGSLELVPNQERGACFRIVLPKGGAS